MESAVVIPNNRCFPRRRLALAAAHDRPELILLDINMPEMSGYEVCTHLKASPDFHPFR